MPTFAIAWIAAAGVYAVGDAQAHHDRSRVGEILRLDDRQSEAADRGSQPVDVAGDLHHHLVLDQAGLGGRRNIHDPLVEARKDLPSGGGPAPAPRRRLRRQPDAALDVGDHGRRAERGELRGGGEIQDDSASAGPPATAGTLRARVPEGGGRMPVLMKKHSASLQFPTMLGNAGGLDAEVGSFDATNGPVVLPGPAVALPEADELVMLPDGKLEAGIEPGREVDEAGIGAGEATDRADGAAGGVAGRRRRIDAAEVGADEAADDVAVAGAGDVGRRRRERGRDGAQVHAGEAAEIAVAGAGDGAGRNGREDRAAGQAGKPADDAVGSGAGD